MKRKILIRNLFDNYCNNVNIYEEKIIDIQIIFTRVPSDPQAAKFAKIQ